jgi:hypothetical protein
MLKLSTPSRLLAALFVAAAVTLSAGSAFAALASGDYVGKTEAEITKSLEQQGYEVEEVAEEDGKLEAEVSLDGKPFEIFTDPQTGKVVEIIEGDEDGDNEGSFLKRLFGIGSD